MTSKKMTSIVIMVMLSIVTLSTLASTSIGDTQGYLHETPIIIFDVAHQQYFNNSHMQSALQMLENLFNATIYINNDTFTYSNLRGADLVILPAPNVNATDVPGTGSSAFTNNERNALMDFSYNGGSILYMVNPRFIDAEMRNYSSNTRMLNGMLGTDPNTDFTSLTIANNNILINDNNKLYDDERFIYIKENASYLNTSHPIIEGRTAEKAVSELLIQSCKLLDTSQATILANTPEDTYALDSSGTVPTGSVGSAYFLAAREYHIDDVRRRAVMCTSAIMFSDFEVPGANQSWFETLDNAQLWENTISWLLYDIPAEVSTPDIPAFALLALPILGAFIVLIAIGSIFFTIGKEVKRVEVSDVLKKMQKREESKKKEDEEIDEAFFAEDIVEEEETIEKVDEKEKEDVAKSMSEELRKKPSRTRSRSERRRRKR